MRRFDQLLDIAAERHGGRDKVMAEMPVPKTPEELRAIPDDRWLSRFTRGVFQAGFNWKVVDAKWDGFEEAFEGFNPARCAMMDDEWFDRLITDTRIIRNGSKIASVRDNAVFLTELASERGSAAAVFANWPSEDYIGLLQLLKSRGSRLGGATGQYSLRFMGVDSYILSRDVVARLIAEGVIDKAPTSKSALAKVQQVFNDLKAESGQSFTVISRVMAMSIG